MRPLWKKTPRCTPTIQVSPILFKVFVSAGDTRDAKTIYYQGPVVGHVKAGFGKSRSIQLFLHQRSVSAKPLSRGLATQFLLYRTYMTIFHLLSGITGIDPCGNSTDDSSVAKKTTRSYTKALQNNCWFCDRQERVSAIS